MNDIDKMPSKCRDCPYWELAKFPWCCGDCIEKKHLNLKPCPFCGGDNLYIVKVDGYLDSTVGVFCNWCKVTVIHEDNDQEGDTPDTRKRAIMAWNRRAKDAE